jgi:ribosome-associated heat shock protein Hsp15
LASKFAAAGRLRVNAERVDKAHHSVRVGDVLTFPQGRLIRVVRVAGLGKRRGPAPEARQLYEDLEPPLPPLAREEDTKPAPTGLREPGSGRPTKAERRAVDRMRQGE